MSALETFTFENAHEDAYIVRKSRSAFKKYVIPTLLGAVVILAALMVFAKTGRNNSSSNSAFLKQNLVDESETNVIRKRDGAIVRDYSSDEYIYKCCGVYGHKDNSWYSISLIVAVMPN